MNIWTKIKSLFASKPCTQSTNHIVIFDGENVSPTAFKKLFRASLKNTQWKWVSGGTIPKVVTKQHIPVEVPLRHGKESADTHIAMDIMHLCYTEKSITMITLVTNDTDFFDVIGYAGVKFPHIKFVLAVDTLRPYRKQSKEKLPSNSTVTYYK